MDNLGLQVGMSMEAVRKLLDGWTDHPILLMGPSDNLYHIWDFTPPHGTGQRPIRLTFNGIGLVVWGEAAVMRGHPVRHGRAAYSTVGNAHPHQGILAESKRLRRHGKILIALSRIQVEELERLGRKSRKLSAWCSSLQRQSLSLYRHRSPFRADDAAER